MTLTELSDTQPHAGIVLQGGAMHAEASINAHFETIIL